MFTSFQFLNWPDDGPFGFPEITRRHLNTNELIYEANMAVKFQASCRQINNYNVRNVMLMKSNQLVLTWLYDGHSHK